MKVLLVYPRCPDTFWGFRHALPFVARKVAMPPLGLLTVGALLPKAWERRLVDMNLSKLKDADLAWADLVFVGGMVIQRESAGKLIHRCKLAGKRVVAGGPLFTTEPETFPEVDHFVLNEAEITLPRFLEDLQAGRPKKMYSSEEFCGLADTPVPQFELLKVPKYAAMNVQYSRGCPFDCDFCDISVLYGRKVRTKSVDQVTAELDALHALRWRGDVFFVDDNFIGNRAKLKADVLPAILKWQEAHGRPFSFQTEASIDLADDAALMEQMVQVGFNCVFVGIETPNDASLAECNKRQNRNRDLLDCVRRIQQTGLQVSGGFILGFDSDPPTVFDRLASFVQNAGIVTAMVGLLNAPRHTKLYRRLAAEGRLLHGGTGDNTDGTMNFVPKMDMSALVEGYRSVIRKIYSLRPYYQRVLKFLREYPPQQRAAAHIGYRHLWALLRSTIRLGVIGRERFQYWKLCFWALFRRPRLFPLAVTYAIYGFHYRKCFREYLK